MIGKTISHYKIVDKLGEGGMGAVYKAEDTTLRRLVALKVLSSQMADDDEARERFVREAQAASALNHNNITTVYELLEEEGERFIVMEYIEGKTIRDIVESGHVSIRKALDIITQAAEALEAAHNKGILHRDVKSANIMVSMEGNVKVMDFGLAHLEERSKLTRTGTTMGTLAYSSPEQLMGRPVDRCSEIFSLGVVFYELLTGQLPFKSPSEGELVFEIINKEQDKPSKLREDVPESVEAVVTRLLEKASDLRYQSCGELINDLIGIRNELETTIVPDTVPPATAQHVPRRTKAVMLLGGTIALIAVVLAIILIILPSSRKRNIEGEYRIAVLPMENVSGDPNQDIYAFGMTDALISQLQKIKALIVRPANAAIQLKEKGASHQEIARQLDVDAFIEASWLTMVDQVRISVKLYDVAENRYRWTQDYDRNLSERTSLFSELAMGIAQEINITLTPDEETRLADTHAVNPEAYDATLLGRFFWNKRTKEGFEAAIDHFSRAISTDSLYAPPYAGLADSYAMLSNYGFLPPSEAYPRAKAAALKALSIDNTLAEAWTSLASIQLFYDWDWEGSEESYRRAIDLNPNYATAHQWYANHLSRRGRHTEAIAEARRAREIDPTSLIINRNVGRRLFFAGQYDQAIEQSLKTLEMNPSFIPARVTLARAYLHSGRHVEAIDEWEQILSLSGRQPEYLAWSGHALALAGKRSEALEVLRELDMLGEEEILPIYQIATIYIALDETERAFELLNQAFRERLDSMLNLKIDPAFEKIRADPRFQNLLQVLGIPQ